MTSGPLRCGDSVPWFTASTFAETKHSLCVMAGRWIVLYFVNNLSDPIVIRTLAEIITKLGRFFNDDHVIFYAVLNASPAVGTQQFIAASHRGLGFIKDEDGALTRLYGATDIAQLIVIDPLLRIEKIFSPDQTEFSVNEICTYLSKLPQVDNFSGTPSIVPALSIPHVFEPEFCSYLVELHQKNSGKETGFMFDEKGKTKVIVDHEYKSRTDFIFEDNHELCVAVRDKIIRRVVPMMERFFQYRPTRIERYMVSCYDAISGGHFLRHRDNVNKGAEHRRFAMTINLNQDYEGCDLMFPEFGRTVYKIPLGSALVFSTAILHQVTLITQGCRYAFIPFFYGEEDVALRLKNNTNMHAGEKLYAGDGDKLFP